MRTPCAWAFDPIVDVAARRVYAQEALVRLAVDPGASLASVVDDWAQGVIQAARYLGVATRLAIDLPQIGAHGGARVVEALLDAAQRADLPAERLIFEIPYEGWVPGQAVARKALADYRTAGFAVALDHFGVGYAGLGVLADFHPDIIKIDASLVCGIGESRSKQAVVKGVLSVARDFHIELVAMGVEGSCEVSWLQAQGVSFMQGCYATTLYSA